MRASNAAALVVVALLVSASGRAAIDPAAAKSAFDAFQRNCSRDNGALWGVSLCGGVAIVDPQTREAMANDGWAGKLPDAIGIANTAFDWRGARWSMVRWPLPKDDAARDRILLHERFHAIQDRLGLPMSPPAANAHLDTLEGRYLMRMEMRALRDAVLGLKGKRNAARKALANALAYRLERFEKFKGAAASESALDHNEGMAEYTGVKLFTDDRNASFDAAARGLEEGEKSDSFARTYAYATGPAWGLLMDEFRANWRPVVAQQTFEQLLSPFALKVAPPASKEVMAEEQKRETERVARVAGYVRRFVEGPVLTLPLRNMSMQMDPYDAHPFDGHGTVYEHITVSDNWGRIVVTKGALVASDFTKLTTPVGAYDLELAPGYRVVAGARKGDLTVEKAQ